MTKRGAKVLQDPLTAVVMFDQNLMDNHSEFIRLAIQRLEQQFENDKSVRTTSRYLNFPNSVEWITPKTDENGKKIPNEWKQENFLLLIMKSSFISECIRTAFNRDQSLNNLLSSMLLGTKFDEKKSVKIVVLKEEGAGSNGATAKKKKRLSHLNMKLNRIEEGKLFEWLIKCQVVNGVEICLEPKSLEELAGEILRATKSVVHTATIQNDEVFVTGVNDVWIPRKSGPPVAISNTGGQYVGLLLLWQRHLMQISKAIGCEQAKVISTDDNFSSPTQCIQTYENCPTQKEGELVLSKSCVIRPPGAVKDLLALRGSRPNIGPDTSRKVYRVMSSTNGDEKL